MYQIIVVTHQFSKHNINETIKYPVKRKFKYLFAENDKTDWREAVWDTKEIFTEAFDLYKFKIYRSLSLFLTRFKGPPECLKFGINLVLND